MEITLRMFRTIQIIEASGELDLYNAHLLREAVQRAVLADARAIVLSLKAIQYIDSSGVAALLSINAQLTGKPRPFRIINISRPVLRVMELTRLTGFLPIAASELDAIESIEAVQKKVRAPRAAEASAS